jgi:hypothetical protein
MSANTCQKILGAIKQWFEIARYYAGPVPIPVRVRIDEAEHHRSMSIQEYRIINQRRKQ